MFSEKQISAYRSIRAPEELRERVVCKARKNAEKGSGNWAIRLAPIAAAFLLILGLAFFLPQNPLVSVFVDGNALTGTLEWESASRGPERSVTAVSLPFEIQSEEETVISVSRGFLITEDDALRTSLTFDGEIAFRWELRQGETEAQMEISCGKNLRRIAISYDDAQNKFLIKEI
ncbi:MAG: hypothetical protein IKJ74_02745 [Clostridia bacterium]|nr:hypothetical protein [Clostridia bacterium]